MANTLKSLRGILSQLEDAFFPSLWPRHSLAFMPSTVQHNELTPKGSSFDFRSIFDGFLWGVPTCRRSAEKRMMRKYGAANWHNKLILPRKDLKVCVTCGHYHEENRLCPNCYAKVKAETTAMQEKIVQELGCKPIEQDVVVVYQGERSEEELKGRRIIEINKPRPKWFSKNLLQKSGPVTELGNSETVSIKPNELG